MLIEAASAAACLGGMAWAYLGMPHVRIRRNLIRADLGKGAKIRYVVKELKEKYEILAHLPNGVNPQIFYERKWQLRQCITKHVEVHVLNPSLVQINGYYTLIPEFNYEPDQTKLKEMYVPVLLGRTWEHEVIFDMKKVPHLLISGMTGYGKSTLLRVLITSWLLHGLELILVDPKRTEFHVFKALKNPNIRVNLGKERSGLLYVQKELNRRLREMEKKGLALWDGKAIVVVVDEVPLLKGEKDMLEILEELAGIGRAAGIFLVQAMQRPDADVIDGKLKNNMGTRVSFRQSNETNSRVAIDSGIASELGADSHGLMVLGDSGELVRCPWLDVEGARRLLEPFQGSEGVKEGSEGKNAHRARQKDTRGIEDVQSLGTGRTNSDVLSELEEPDHGL